MKQSSAVNDWIYCIELWDTTVENLHLYFSSKFLFREITKTPIFCYKERRWSVAASQPLGGGGEACNRGSATTPGKKEGRKGKEGILVSIFLRFLSSASQNWRGWFLCGNTQFNATVLEKWRLKLIS